MTEQFIGKKKLSLSLLIKIVKDTGQGFIDDSVTRLSGSLALCDTIFNYPLSFSFSYYWGSFAYGFG